MIFLLPLSSLEFLPVFLTLSCADLRWEELPYIADELTNLGLREEELS